MALKQETVSIKISDDVTSKHVVCAGICLPQLVLDDHILETGFAGQLQKVKELETRDDDVVLAAYPRSGTHWTWEIISMLLKGEASYEKMNKNCTSMDWFGFEELSRRASPRVLNTHFPPSTLPRSVMEKRNKIVHVQRNSKDVLNSFYKFLIANWPKMAELETFDTFLKHCTGYYDANVSFICSWTHYVKAWEELTKQKPGQILNLFYEDITEDPIREIRKLNDFLQCNRSDDLIRKIAEACSFNKLKEADSTKQHQHPRVRKIHRKGEVGDWKNGFTVAQNEFIDQWLEKNLIDTDLKFRYTCTL